MGGTEPHLRWSPGLGGKVSSLRPGGRGREWLAPPVRPYARPRPGQDWGEGDCSGWDECFPNIAASADGSLADHGDVWRLAWDAAEPGALSGSVALSGSAALSSSAARSGSVAPSDSVALSGSVALRGSVAPSGSAAPPGRDYRFAREITAEGGLLRVDYRVRNLGERPLAWAWAQHMLLAADEETRIVSSSPMRLRVDCAFADGVIDGAADVEWLLPAGAPTTAISLGGAAGRAAKLWFEPPVPAVVAVVRGADRLAWRVADSSFPDLGLWVNLGGWGGTELRHVAVEPAFGAHDRPADAYARLTPLAPRAQHAWSVLVELGTDNDEELFMH